MSKNEKYAKIVSDIRIAACGAEKPSSRLLLMQLAADAIVELTKCNFGEWVEEAMNYKCSACGKTVKDEIFYMLDPYQLPPHCPYCGAKLEPPKEDNK